MWSRWVSEAFRQGEESRALAGEGGPFQGGLPSPRAHCLAPAVFLGSTLNQGRHSLQPQLPHVLGSQQLPHAHSNS